MDQAALVFQCYKAGLWWANQDVPFLVGAGIILPERSTGEFRQWQVLQVATVCRSLTPPLQFLAMAARGGTGALVLRTWRLSLDRARRVAEDYEKLLAPYDAVIRELDREEPPTPQRVLGDFVIHLRKLGSQYAADWYEKNGRTASSLEDLFRLDSRRRFPPPRDGGPPLIRTFGGRRPDGPGHGGRRHRKYALQAEIRRAVERVGVRPGQLIDTWIELLQNRNEFHDLPQMRNHAGALCVRLERLLSAVAPKELRHHLGGSTSRDLWQAPRDLEGEERCPICGEIIPDRGAADVTRIFAKSPTHPFAAITGRSVHLGCWAIGQRRLYQRLLVRSTRHKKLSRPK